MARATGVTREAQTGHGVTGSGVTGHARSRQVTGSRGHAGPHRRHASQRPTLRLGPGFHISPAFGGGKISHFMGFGGLCRCKARSLPRTPTEASCSSCLCTPGHTCNCMCSWLTKHSARD